MRTLLLLSLLLACEKPVPPPVKATPSAPVEVAKPEPPPPPKPAVPELEPEPEPEPDPPGTLYSWEDERGGLHMTQSPPPPGAKLRSKEFPRASRPAPKRAVVEPTKSLAEMIADEINTFREDPVPKAKALSGPARQALLSGRRAYFRLSWSDKLAGLAHTRHTNSEYASALDMPERLVSSFTFKDASVEDLLATKTIADTILDAGKRFIGGHCRRTLCTFVLTDARPK